MNINYFILSLLLLFLCQNTWTQEKNGRVPVNSVFWGTHLVDRQTTTTVAKGELQMEILHRFATMDNGFSNLFGVYGSSNISMGLNYGLLKRMDAQFFTQKFHKVTELGLKYRVLQQSIDNTMPLSVSYYTSLSIDGRDKQKFGEDYASSDRYSFQNEIIIARQLDYQFNVQASLAYVHANAVDQLQQSDKYDINLAAGYKLSRSKSVFANYQHAGNISWLENNKEANFKPEPSITFGYESSTRTHNFQVFLTTRDKINLGKDLAYNLNPISFKNLRIGFNIRVRLVSPKKNKEKHS